MNRCFYAWSRGCWGFKTTSWIACASTLGQSVWHTGAGISLAIHSERKYYLHFYKWRHWNAYVWANSPKSDLLISDKVRTETESAWLRVAVTAMTAPMRVGILRWLSGWWAPHVRAFVRHVTVISLWGLSGGTRGKECACQCGKHETLWFNSWVGNIPWRRAWQLILVFLPEKSLGQRTLEGSSP